MTAIVPVNEKTKEVQALIKKLAPRLGGLLPKHLTGERMARLLNAMMYTTPELTECTEMSLISAFVECSVLGLEPNTPMGHAWLIPYHDKKSGQTVAQMQIGYKGLMNLALRSDKLSRITARIVYKNDQFKIVYGTEETLDHVPPALGQDRGPIVGVYAVAFFADKTETFVCLSEEEVMQYKGKSQSGGSKFSPWNDPLFKLSMYLKTAVRRLAWMLPMETELATVIGNEDKRDAGIRQEFELEMIEAESKPVDDGGAFKERAEGIQKRARQMKAEAQRVADAAQRKAQQVAAVTEPATATETATATATAEPPGFVAFEDIHHAMKTEGHRFTTRAEFKSAGELSSTKAGPVWRMTFYKGAVERTLNYWADVLPDGLNSGETYDIKASVGKLYRNAPSYHVSKGGVTLDSGF